MRWQCQYVDSKGIRCKEEAFYRLHFAEDHPFEHVDVCKKHEKEYRFYKWIQTGIMKYGEKEDE